MGGTSSFDSESGAYAKDASVEELKEFCRAHRIKVDKTGRNGKATKSDYVNAINEWKKKHHRNRKYNGKQKQRK